jgi:hypothetical protein
MGIHSYINFALNLARRAHMHKAIDYPTDTTRPDFGISLDEGQILVVTDSCSVPHVNTYLQS